MKTKYGPSEKDKKPLTSIDIKCFRKTAGYIPFDRKRINKFFGRAESRTSGRETNKIKLNGYGM